MFKTSGKVVVLGIDPGSRCTGYGVVRETSGCLELLDTGTIRTNGRDDLSMKLDTIFTRICSLIREYSPDQAAVEEVFTSKNASSALKLGQARGAVIVACSHQRVPVYSYEPTLVKKSLVGAGRAGKDQVAFMVAQMLGCRPNWAQDASDALAVAIAHLNQRRAAVFGVLT
ncbi:crossover junction endodeoxyribonuclease RuvC [Desulfonatronospira sp.]|uniref:crossover junction endodeoxyribonuclease RuvC n=1 Tax=Desulfonatronospira sp. TaxID=1962951 RepID=UPI0025BECC07|nr:crossover junction endodeoxyribonuclease RuvC [Desulfonatronospira sp.]